MRVRDAAVRFARRSLHSEQQALSVGPKVDCDREAVARAVQSLVLRPAPARAAMWGAQSVVLSVTCSTSLLPSPPSGSGIALRSPLAVQRRYRRCAESQSPSSRGRSRQGTLVRPIERTASRTRRWATSGRPRRRLGSITNGVKNARSWSLIKPHTTAGLLQQDRRRITQGRVGGSSLANGTYAA